MTDNTKGRMPLEEINHKEMPVRHDGLPESWTPFIEKTFREAGRHICATLEEWRDGFLRDTNPGKEIFLWLIL